jgi:hypothetical protein
MIQKKLHPTKKLGAPRKNKKGKMGPSAVSVHNLRKVAAYHCQTIIFTMVDKTSEKAKHAAIEEVFYGNVSKNVIGACQQLVNGDHAFANLYNNYEGEDGNERVLKSSCCGQDTTSNYVAGRDFTTEMLQTFSNGKPFQGRAIWKMADSVLALLKKALSLVTQLSPTIVMIDTTCREVGYASGKNEQSFLQAIDKGIYEMDKNERMGLDTDDDDKLAFSGDEDGGDDTVVAVVDSDVDSLMSNLKDGVCPKHVGCFGSSTRFQMRKVVGK